MVTLLFTGLSYFLWEKKEWRQKVKLFILLIL